MQNSEYGTKSINVESRSTCVNFSISTDIKHCAGPSVIAELLAQNMKHIADLPLLLVSVSYRKFSTPSLCP